MQRFTIVLGIVLLGAATKVEPFGREADAVSNVSIDFFEVPVDHFRLQDSRVAPFNYEFNSAYYNGTGPLFIYINELNQYTNRWLQSGLIHDLAQSLGGALITTQLRFFGQNTPTEDADWDNLSLLTVEQILADLAVLISAAKTNLGASNTTQVFVWGPGFGGTLAVLARQKYPNLVDGAWSSGGIFEPAPSTTEVYENLADIIAEHGGQRCSERLTSAFEQIDREFGSGNATTLMNEFSLCRPWNLASAMDRWFFMETMLLNIQSTIESQHSSGLQNLCHALDAIPSDSFRSFARWTRFTFEADFGFCFNLDSIGRHRWLADPMFHNPGTASGRRQLLYLQCTQLGQFFVSDAEPSPAFGSGIALGYRRELCEAAFGSDFNFYQLHSNVESFNNTYGGRNPRVDHVIFSNGELDATNTLGINEYHGRESLVLNIPAYGKATDLESISVRDSLTLHGAKTEIVNMIRRWVQA